MPQDASLDAANKSAVYANLRAICRSPIDTLADAVSAAYTKDAKLFVSHPIDECRGVSDIAANVWAPLRDAFPDLERRDLILAAGRHNDAHFVAAMGHYQATFLRDWLDIPATHGVVMLRFAEIHRVHEGRIDCSWVLIDLLDLMRQAGCWPIAPSLGAEATWPGPANNAGVSPDAVNPGRGSEAMSIVLQMHQALFDFDGVNIESMDHGKYWTRDFMWYGPGGIGTARGLKGFREVHQIPFLRAFPDRRGGKHVARIADGDFVVTGGWPSVIATHTGPDWLGIGATGKPVGMRVMDFYRVDGNRIAENWVPLDIIDILRQLGVDVFARMRHMQGQPRQTL